jgi:hypothetical protein
MLMLMLKQSSGGSIAFSNAYLFNFLPKGVLTCEARGRGTPAPDSAAPAVDPAPTGRRSGVGGGPSRAACRRTPTKTAPPTATTAARRKVYRQSSGRKMQSQR